MSPCFRASSELALETAVLLGLPFPVSAAPKSEWYGVKQLNIEFCLAMKARANIAHCSIGRSLLETLLTETIATN